MKVRDAARQLEETEKEPKRTTRQSARATSIGNDAERANAAKRAVDSSNDGRAMLRQAL